MRALIWGLLILLAVAPSGLAQQVIHLPPNGLQVIPPPGTASITIAPQVSPSPTPTATPTPTPTATPSPSPSPSPSPGQVPVIIGPTVGNLNGSAAGIPGVPTDPSTYGQYNAPGGAMPGGMGLIGGPLLDDLTAAQKVVATQKSTVELDQECRPPQSSDAAPCPHGALNAADNGYFESTVVHNPAPYVDAVNAFHAAWRGRNQYPLIARIDGACPLINPSNAEVLQWAANKWGLHPLLMYSEAVYDGAWDTEERGDRSADVGGVIIGGSSGMTQVADRNTLSRPNHAIMGLAGSNLARENSCFGADVMAERVAAIFYGFADNPAITPAHNIGVAIESWLEGNGVTAPGKWTSNLEYGITNKCWSGPCALGHTPGYFGGANVPY